MSHQNGSYCNYIAGNSGAIVRLVGISHDLPKYPSHWYHDLPEDTLSCHVIESNPELSLTSADEESLIEVVVFIGVIYVDHDPTVSHT